MGKRRIRNLFHHGIPKEAIVGCEPDAERASAVAAEYGISVTGDFQGALESFKPDAIIVSTPPDAHAPYMLEAARRKIHVFVEVTTVDTGYAELLPLLDGSFVAAPSCTFRYFPAVQRIKELIAAGAIGTPRVFQHYLGQYLPDWHPFEDYRNVYFSKKETGGAREMFPYELVWLTDVLGGGIADIDGIRGTISDLDITADDVYAATIRLTNNVVGTLLIDLLNRKARRTFMAVGSEGTLDWDWLAREICVTSPDGTVETFPFPQGETIGKYNTAEDAYQNEIGDFLLAIRGKKAYPYTFKEDAAYLRCIDRIRDL